MKKVISLVVVALMVLCSHTLFAQGGIPEYHLDATTNGTTMNVPNDGFYLLDQDYGSNGTYVGGTDYSVTMTANCPGINKLALKFELFDIAPQDTLYIYDGPSTSSVLLLACNNSLNPQNSQIVYASSVNVANTLTLRLAAHTSNGRGFRILVSCTTPCEKVTPHIDSMFFKTMNGQVVDTGYIKIFTTQDTSYEVKDTMVWVQLLDSLGNPLIDQFGNEIWEHQLHHDSILHVQENIWRGVHLCLGQGVQFLAHGEYTHSTGAYNPTDMTSTFYWNFGNGVSDELTGNEGKRVDAYYKDLDCYDVILQMEDEWGCRSTTYESVRVRVAQNPVKTLFDLNTICNNDSLLVNVGYEGENGTITLKKITFNKTKTRENNTRKFIPDGKCPTPNGNESECFSAKVNFDDFPSGRSVTTAADICSICINSEHSFMGDCTYAIICPNGSKAILKNKSQSPGDPQYTGGGGGIFLGIPYGGSNDGAWDNTGHKCDSLYNMYGLGWNYCFSRDTISYALRQDNGHATGLATPNAAVSTSYTFGVIPAPFVQAGQTCGLVTTSNTQDSSDHNGKTGYYLPFATFDELIGCPLNGEWNVEFCDTWGADNGWIFSFSVDICGISSGAGCEYQVGLDSVIWRPDTSYGDFDLGYYRGALIRPRDAVNSYISTPDTAGTFGLHVTLYDEFGCVWDTLTHISSVWKPMPNLGDDVTLCDAQTMVIDATDEHTGRENQTFLWEPFGDSTAIITTRNYLGHDVTYRVEVTNSFERIPGEITYCSNRDSIKVKMRPQPIPNFDPGIYPLEGCEPFTINIANSTTSAAKYTWIWGDGDSSFTENPTHIYGAGHYDLKYYVESEGGCQDSLIFPNLITVFSSPVAKFSWEPVNPTVMHPEVHFINKTEPQADTNKYYWEIQYDRDKPLSYHTLTDVSPSFQWYTDGEDISGTYVARLIAKTNNLGPSGLIVECRDTVENTILLVNDFLQFPTVITANGDGINDVFEIKNLVNGLGYPNNSLAIYNRWGKRVYYKENISSEDDWWDPAKENIPAGTYFWHFSGKGYLGNIQRSGSVEVLNN